VDTLVWVLILKKINIFYNKYNYYSFYRIFHLLRHKITCSCNHFSHIYSRSLRLSQLTFMQHNFTLSPTVNVAITLHCFHCHSPSLNVLHIAYTLNFCPLNSFFTPSTNRLTHSHYVARYPFFYQSHLFFTQYTSRDSVVLLIYRVH